MRLGRFLFELERTGSVAIAARIAELNVTHLYRLRREQPLFARRWDIAVRAATDRLEELAMRRATT